MIAFHEAGFGLPEQWMFAVRVGLSPGRQAIAGKVRMAGQGSVLYGAFIQTP
jgi:hypothetical protein